MATTKPPITPEQAAAADLTVALAKLTPETRTALEDFCEELLSEGLAATVVRCRRADAKAIDQGGTKGWRPSGRDALPIRVALELLGL